MTKHILFSDSLRTNYEAQLQVLKTSHSGAMVGASKSDRRILMEVEQPSVLAA